MGTAELMAVALAFAPIGLLLVLLLGARWSAAAAGAAAATLAIVLAVTVFDAGAAAAPTVAGPVLEALFQSASILWIIFPALCIHEYQMRTGGTAAFGRALARLSDDPRIVALLIAWFFVSFLEGAAGFGTPVALAAPLLVTAGFTPRTALLLALVGSAAAVPFGAIGTPMVPLLAATALDPQALSLAVVMLNASVGWMMALLLVKIAAADRPVPATGAVTWAGGAAILFFVPSAVLAWGTGPELPSLGGAIIGGLAFVALLRWRAQSVQTLAAADADEASARDLVHAALPYLIVVALILVTRLVPSLAALLSGVQIRWTLDDNYQGAVAPLVHPGTMLMLGFVVAGLLARGGRSLLPSAAGNAAHRLPGVALALIMVLTLARTMVHSGMIELLAKAAADAIGGALPMISPAIGALGAFVTGSGTASNILLGGFQVSAAERADVPPMLAAAGQAVGAAAGNLIAPHNIVAGAAAVGLVGREGEILRRTLPITLAHVAAAGTAGLLAAALLWSA